MGNGTSENSKTVGRIDYSSAQVTIREYRGGWRAHLSYKVMDGYRQEGADEAGNPAVVPVYKWKQKTKVLSADANTDTKRKREVRTWIDQLMSDQAKAIAQAEEDAREEEQARERKAREAIPTVYAYALGRVEFLRKTKSVAAGTIDAYLGCCAHLECFSDTRLDELTHDMIQNWVTDQTQKYAPLTLRKVIRWFKRVCTDAQAAGLISSNPFGFRSIKKEFRLPKARTQMEKNALDEEEARHVAALLREKAQTPYVVAARIALQTGLREGEISALRWQNVDFKNRVLTVAYNIARSTHGSSLANTKRESSDRRIPMNDELTDILRSRRAAMVEECQADGVPTDRVSFGNLYVLGDTAGNFYEPYRISRAWAVIASYEDIRGVTGEILTFHGLRHSFASISLSGGADVMAVAANLGHSDPSITMKTYASASEAGKRKAASIVGNATAPVGNEVIEFKKAAN